MSDTRILLATGNIGFEHRLRQAFGTLNGDLRRWRSELMIAGPAAAVGAIAAEGPDVVALGPGMPVESALELASRLERDRPEIGVLLIAEPTPQLWEQALRAGIRDVLAPNATDAEMRGTFERALEVAARRRSNLVGGDTAAGPKGHVVTVLSPKGGSGKTTVATNLALGLALKEPGEAVIVDLDLQFGDVATVLRLAPQHTMADAVRSIAALDAMALKSYLTSHPSELWALCAPDSPAQGEQIPAAHVGTILRLLADEFRYVIVDTSAGLSEHALSALEVSTDLLLLCAMDVPSVRSLVKEIAALDQLGMTSQRRHFLLNRADSRVGLDSHDVEATVGMRIDVALPSARSVPLSMNQGSPVMEAEPRSPVSRQLAALVDRFAPQPAERSGGLLRWRK